MSWRASAGAAVLMAVAAALLFWAFQRQIGGSSPAFYLPPEVFDELEAALADQKRLAELDPERQAAYRAHFARLETTLGRLRIVEHNRERLLRRYELLLLALMLASVVLGTVWYAVRQARHGPRLATVQAALEQLTEGRGPIRIGDRSGDTLGRIARMIEATSDSIARTRRRLQSLENLSRWQETARRHAHEMRGPLTAARLGVDRLRRLLDSAAIDGDDPTRAQLDDLEGELKRLSDFTEGFAGFARLRRPRREAVEIGPFLEEFATTYSDAWPRLRLRLGPLTPATAAFDRDMIRQVLVNLCDNSARALAGEPGQVRFDCDVDGDEVGLTLVDNGPGISEAVRERLFEPYVTTRPPGAGMGLGLAISRKILLDHGGDLELLDSVAQGAAFRLTLPRATR